MLPMPTMDTTTLLPYTTLFRSVYRFLVAIDDVQHACRCAGFHEQFGKAQRNARVLPNCSWKPRSQEHTSELQSHVNLVCRLLLEKKKQKQMRSAAAPAMLRTLH